MYLCMNAARQNIAHTHRMMTKRLTLRLHRHRGDRQNGENLTDDALQERRKPDDALLQRRKLDDALWERRKLDDALLGTA